LIPLSQQRPRIHDVPSDLSQEGEVVMRLIGVDVAKANAPKREDDVYVAERPSLNQYQKI